MKPLSPWRAMPWHPLRRRAALCRRSSLPRRRLAGSLQRLSALLGAKSRKPHQTAPVLKGLPALVTADAASPDLHRWVERLSCRPGRFRRSALSVCFAVKPAGYSGGFPTIVHCFGVRRSVDERYLAEHEAGNGFGIASVALGDPAADRKTAIDLILDLGDCNRVDDVGDDPGHAVVTDLGLERRSGGRQLVHLTQGRKPHVVREGRAYRVGPNNLVLVVHCFRCRDPVHAHGSVILGLDLLDCAIESHDHVPSISLAR